MITVDTNVLVYAHRRDSEWHDAAAAAVRGPAESAVPWAIPWPCLHEFLAIATHPAVFDAPTPLAQALEQVEGWLEAPALVLRAERGGYWSRLRVLAETARASGPRVHDARIAALCVSHGVER